MFPGWGTHQRVLNVANFLKSRNLILEKISKNKGWFLGRGTLLTRNMCFLVRVTHITRDVFFVGREHISVGMCVSQVTGGKNIKVGGDSAGCRGILTTFSAPVFSPCIQHCDIAE